MTSRSDTELPFDRMWCFVRPRPAEALRARHTFISTALTVGLNVKFVGEYTGTSLDMIEKRYGRSLAAEAGAPLAMIDVTGPAKPSTFGGGLPVGARKYAAQGASPTGFEPVLPT